MRDYKIEYHQSCEWYKNLPHFLSQHIWHEIKEIGFFAWSTQSIIDHDSTIAIFRVHPKNQIA